MNIPIPAILWTIPKVYVAGCALIIFIWFVRGSHKHGALDYALMFLLVLAMILIGNVLLGLYKW